MLKKLILENWKSFRYAELPVDPLTILIGTNASGKSNAVEALEFLRRVAVGDALDVALVGNFQWSPIRGGLDLAVFQHEKQFTLKIIVQGNNEVDYSYSITVATKPYVRLLEESIVGLPSDISYETTQQQSHLTPIHQPLELFHVGCSSSKSNLEITKIFGVNLEPSSVESSLAQLGWLSSMIQHGVFESGKQASLDSFEVLKEAVIAIYNTLVSIFILDPAPIKMRSYSSVSHQLADDAANIAGVLAALSDEKKSSVESTLSNYIVHLPEQDMRKVWAETVGRLNTDAMLYCEESWASDKPPMVIDARGMSDGTLRFLAIVTAILTRPEGSQLVIEEVDNGLHPSRAELLLKMLKELGAKRKIDILVTTHNPALLNALEPEMIPFVVVAHRDAQTGESKLTPLDDIQRLPKLLASGHVGDLATQGVIEKSLSQ